MLFTPHGFIVYCFMKCIVLIDVTCLWSRWGSESWNTNRINKYIMTFSGSVRDKQRYLHVGCAVSLSMHCRNTPNVIHSYYHSRNSLILFLCTCGNVPDCKAAYVEILPPLRELQGFVSPWSLEASADIGISSGTWCLLEQ